MKLRKKHFVVVIILVVIIFGGWFYFQGRSTKNVKIETAKAEVRTLVVSVSSSGKTKAKKAIDLHFQTLGRLAWIGVAEGDTVTAYQTLANLDTAELRKNLDKALRDYSKERNDFEEDRTTTYKDKVVTDTVKRILEKNQWDLEKAVIDVELDTITLNWAYLTTPISGIVTHIDTPVSGINVTAADTITIVDPTTLVFSANVDETDIGKVHEGNQAFVDLDAYPESEFNGTVSKVAYTAELTSSGSTVFPVEISLSQLPEIRLGLNGDVQIVSNQKADTLVVPIEAVIETDGKQYVVKKIGQRFEKKPVTVGLSSEDEKEIISGISTGDEVVVEGFQFLPKGLLNGAVAS